MINIQSVNKYNVVYVAACDDIMHVGMLKIGKASLDSNLMPEELTPNCDLLNQAAHERCKKWSNTIGIPYRLIYTELAVRTNQAGKLVNFMDHDVHVVMERSGFPKQQLNGTNSQEWFKCTEGVAISAIKATKENRYSLTGAEKGIAHDPVILRVEQEDAIKAAQKAFKKSDTFLWNAKMRFGKTLSALTLVKRERYRKVIIVTHRPVVGSGWNEDFDKVFTDEDHYLFVFKEAGKGDFSQAVNDEIIDQKNDARLRNLDETGAHFIYFASIQDLRGSTRVGGNLEKNNAVFDMEWDLIIIDEAHEGTQTPLGKNVEDSLRNKAHHTKLLALSGTPFNIIDQYGDNVYTWDYIKEQQAKEEWETLHPGDWNPYGELPQMHIYTFDIGNKLPGYVADDLSGKAFNFREFFRTWTGNPDIDRKQLPNGVNLGDFVHKDDVSSFLNLITQADDDSFYPYATEEFRDMFRHTLWMVPGVKEAKALSAALRDNPIFSTFGIANVAGEGDDYEREHSDDALQLVRDTIAENEYSITLSCGKLTTGVTVKEWTAVLMLSGSASTAASGYMQTIFRVQSAGSINGKQKTDCYVFDFAPDRTLKVLADVVERSAQRRNGSGSSNTEDVMGEFLNYCPIISFAGTQMKTYDVVGMMGQLKRIFVERAIRSGFDDNSIYDSKRLLQLTELDAKAFNDLHDIIGHTAANPGKRDVEVNASDLGEEQHTKKGKGKKHPEKPDEAEKRRREELKKKKEERKKAISILRSISIRMPLLIYGADVPFDQDITIDYFVEMVDPQSWKEFMPDGISKARFKKYIQYYDKNVFVSAGREIRRLAKEADNLTPTERVKSIATIFGYFRNPDKETVLTPWRVVNMHMGDIMGGWNFWDEKWETQLDSPRFIDQGKVTADVLNNPNAQVMEINSKSGLYPLYVAYSLYRAKLGKFLHEDDMPVSVLQKLWADTLRDNLYVICKTAMAEKITWRTLRGYQDCTLNTYCREDLVEALRNPNNRVTQTVKRPSTWGKDGAEPLKIDAIVGNPPYQSTTNGGTASGTAAKQATPIFNLFVSHAKQIQPNYISMIIPARWYNGGIGLNDFRNEMLNDRHIIKLVDYSNSKECFPTVDIAGGLCYFLWDANHENTCEVTNVLSGERITLTRELGQYETAFIRSNLAISIIEKIRAIATAYVSDMVSAIDTFGIPSKEKGHSEYVVGDIVLIHSIGSNSQGQSYISKANVKKNIDLIDKYKVKISIMVPQNGEVGVDPTRGYRSISTPQILYPGQVDTFSYLNIGFFDSENEAVNFRDFMTCKFPRFMMRTTYSSVHISKSNFIFVPMMDFTHHWTDEELYNYFDLNEDEITLIEKTMRPLIINAENGFAEN